MHAGLAAQIKENALVPHIEQWRSQQLLPDDAFDWIEESGRQPNWLLLYISRTHPATHDYPVELTPKERFIVFFDLLTTPKAQKGKFLEQVKVAWVKRQKEDNYFSWYANGAKKKLKCKIAWQWYQDHHPDAAEDTPRFSNFTDILEFYDRTAFSLDERRYHLTKVQKKFKAMETAERRKGKRQTNLTLSDDTRIMLDKITEKERRILFFLT